MSRRENPFERDMKVQKKINKALKNNVPFLFTVLNGLRMICSYTDEDVAKGAFDQLRIVETDPMSSTLKMHQKGSFSERRFCCK